MNNVSDKITLLIEEIFTKLGVEKINDKTARELIDTHTKEYLELRLSQILTPEEKVKLNEVINLDITSMVSQLNPELREKVEKCLDEVYIVYLPNVANNLVSLLSQAEQQHMIEKVKTLII